MDLKIGWLLLIYYGFWALIFIFGSMIFVGYNQNFTSNGQYALANAQYTKDMHPSNNGGTVFWHFSVFDVILYPLKLIGFVFLGIGLPENTPVFFVILFATWQTTVSIFTTIWVISGLWNG